MTAVAFTEPSSDDEILAWAQMHTSEAEAALNNLDGANLQAGTVPVSKLQKKKAFFTVTVHRAAALTTSDVTGFFTWMVPTVDGASVNVTFLGASVAFGDASSGPTAVNTAYLDVVAVNGGTHATLWTEQIALNTTNISATGGRPYDHAAASGRTISSGNYVRVDYRQFASADYEGLQMVMRFSIEIVAN